MKITKLAFFNPQGNFDKNDSHLTEHPDFGGQLIYVKELAKEISKLGIKVDIITRKIVDEKWPEFSDNFDYYPGYENLRIIRVPFGGNKFLNKEKLWDHLGEYVKQIINFYSKEKKFPDFVTTHYGDGGISGTMFLYKTGINYSFTAHSLGAQKKDKFSNFDEKFLEEKYRFSIRISAERTAIKYASLIVTSTKQEKEVQYMHPAYKDISIQNIKKFFVIPPGVNTSIFNNVENEQSKYYENILGKFNKSFIILSSRIDPKKNHISVVKSYVSNKRLQEKFNLIIVVRGIDDVYKYSQKNTDEAKILNKIITLAKNKNLLSNIIFLNIQSQHELAALYKAASKFHSIFALTSKYEPFGLAIVEAMACGLPILATKFGGPVEILDNGVYGKLVDPDDIEDISKKILEIANNYIYYKEIGIKRVLSNYTWKSTAEKYLEKILHSKNRKIENIELPKFFLKQI
ncbi:glycosyltransferase [Thermosipho atlanticus]|uniref:sucrose-phosphate synthase n=1 Tax=Thermosipho atlanticus DSM 15807 TaxID=1123380 RepID=A0A1M5QMU6_9BACT|nr:glycosyltransferase [Thermosipho atlanticus]SHH15447.1 sucrose-phosphate synthase [Thermosipho atlanticus DSM 15807]